ncbi:MAG: zinc-ribbon domain-containing protein [Lachnospiraceae bacterium]|nr:zinc-ribbon domain-containing protein [Lachnospiraceae bacterium]
MKFCTNCGAQLEDDAKFCTSCGSPVEAAAPAKAPAPAPTPTFVAPNPTPAPAPTYAAPTPTVQPANGIAKPLVALLGGAVGLGTFWLSFLPFGFWGIISFCISVVGFIFGLLSKKSNPGSKMGKLGFIFGIIGMALALILTIIFIIVYADARRYYDYYHYWY